MLPHGSQSWDLDASHRHNSPPQSNDDNSPNLIVWAWQYKTDFYNPAGTFIVSHGLNDNGTTF